MHSGQTTYKQLHHSIGDFTSCVIRYAVAAKTVYGIWIALKTTHVCITCQIMSLLQRQNIMKERVSIVSRMTTFIPQSWSQWIDTVHSTYSQDTYLEKLSDGVLLHCCHSLIWYLSYHWPVPRCIKGSQLAVHPWVRAVQLWLPTTLCFYVLQACCQLSRPCQTCLLRGIKLCPGSYDPERKPWLDPWDCMRMPYVNLVA